MNSYATLCVGEFCTTGSGGTPSRAEHAKYYEGGTIPWVKSGELRENMIFETEERVTNIALQETSIKMVPRGAILLAMYGATVGRLALLGTEATTNQAVCHIVPDPEVADVRYVFHALANQVPKMVGMGVGGAQPNISQGVVKSLKVRLPPICEQRRIAAILDKADALRAKRREALVKLDRLKQAIFVDMFGDPATNPKSWPTTRVGEHLQDVTNGLTRRGKEVEVGKHIVLRLRDIQAGSIDFSEPNRITLNEKERAKYRVSVGELLFVRVNGNPEYVGRCSLFEGHSEEVFFNDHVMRVRLTSGLEGGFLAFFLNRPEGKRQIAKHRKTSAGQHTINQDGLAAISLPLPPPELQKQFLRRLAAVRESYTLHNSGLTKSEALFASLQHSAFRGEL